MKLNIMDNAIDYLENTIQEISWIYENDKSFNNVDTTKHIKGAIVSLSSAAELLIKISLTNINELLIYGTIDDRVLRYYKSDKKHDLHDYLIENGIDVTTIDFRVCINRLFMASNLPESYQRHLHKLRENRNKFIHFGINSKDEYYETMYSIANVLELFDTIDPFRSMIIDYYDELEDESEGAFNLSTATHLAMKIVDYEWGTVFRPRIEVIIDKLESSTENHLFSCNSIMDSFEDLGFIVAQYTINDDEIYEYDLSIKSHPEESALVISNSYLGSPILAVIPVNEKETIQMYIAKSIEYDLVKDFTVEGCFWNSNYKKRFHCLEMSKVSIEKLNKLIDEYYSEYEEKDKSDA